MTPQFISLLVIIAVLVIDFVVNGRKKTVDETQKRIEGNEGLKKFNFTEYLLLRKKNVVIFILFVFLSKPILHTSFFPDTKEAVNYDKKVNENIRSENYYIMNSNKKLVLARDFYDGLWTPLYNLLYHLKFNSEYEAFTKKGEKYILEGSNNNAIVYYYPLETMPLSFNEHLELMFKSKLWIFLVSLGTMAIIIFLFNDKIKAR